MIRARASARALLMLVAALSAAGLLLRLESALPWPEGLSRAQVESWLTAEGAVRASFAVARATGLVLAVYMALLGVLALVAALSGAAGAARVALRVALPSLRPLVATDRRHHAHGDHRRPRWRARARSATTRDAGRGVLRLQPTGHAIGAGGDAGGASCFLGSDDAHRRTGRHVLVDRRGRGSHRRARAIRSRCRVVLARAHRPEPRSAPSARRARPHLPGSGLRAATSQLSRNATSFASRRPRTVSTTSIALRSTRSVELLGQRARRHAVARAQRELQPSMRRSASSSCSRRRDR